METQDVKEDLKEEGLKDHAGDILSHGADYLDTFYKISLLKLTKKVTQIASATISVIAICTLGVFILFFGGLAGGWWLGDLVNSRAGGFLLIAGFYFLLLVCIILLRKKIVFPYIRNLLIRKTYD